MSESPVPTMAATSALYQTQVSEATPPIGSWTRILAADARRYYVKFILEGGLGNVPRILPGPGQDLTVSGTNGDGTAEYHWRDCPSVVTGEWWMDGTGTMVVTIIESLYVGG